MLPVHEQILSLVKQRQIVFSEKARYQLDAEEFDTEDLLNSIIHGQIIKRQRDELRVSQYKYTIIGPAISGKLIYSCGKIVELSDKNYFIITFHETR